MSSRANNMEFMVRTRKQWNAISTVLYAANGYYKLLSAQIDTQLKHVKDDAIAIAFRFSDCALIEGFIKRREWGIEQPA
jgi:hypothetical protein